MKLFSKTSIVIIIGCNSVGIALSKALENNGINVILVDKSLEAFKKLPPDYHGNVLLGDATDERTIAKFSIQEIEAVFILTSSDNANIFIAQMIRQKLKSNPRIVARMNDWNRSETYGIFNLETVSEETLFAESVSLHMYPLVEGE